MAKSTQDKIRETAYYLWEADGGQHGSDMDYWLAAEQKISGKSKAKAPAKKSPVKAVATAKKTAAKAKKTTSKAK